MTKYFVKFVDHSHIETFEADDVFVSDDGKFVIAEVSKKVIFIAPQQHVLYVKKKV